MKQDINMNLLYEQWPDFKRAAFALYDDEHVYVFQHPLFLPEEDDGYTHHIQRLSNCHRQHE